MERRFSGQRIAAAVGALLLATLLGACNGEAPAAAGDAATPPGTDEPVAPAPAATPPATFVPGSLIGTWWGMSVELPHKGLRMTFETPAETSPTANLSGSWVSFDWRNSDGERSLVRESRAVAITALRAGDEWIVQGPAPQIDARGQPSGDRGDWELRVKRISLPGEEIPRYSGRLKHTDLTPAEGVTVELTPRFRVFDRDR